MAVKTHVGFVAEFPSDYDGGPPAGRKLANFISENLREFGFDSETPADNEGWSWEFVTADSEFSVYSIVGLVGDMDSIPPRQWLITNDSNLGILKRIFVGTLAVRKHEAKLRKFCECLHEIMCADTRFAHITRYNGDTFDKPNDEPGECP